MHKAFVKICQYLRISLSGTQGWHQSLLHHLPEGAVWSALRWACGRAWSVTAWGSERLLVHGAYSLPSQLLPHYILSDLLQTPHFLFRRLTWKTGSDKTKLQMDNCKLLKAGWQGRFSPHENSSLYCMQGKRTQMLALFPKCGCPLFLPAPFPEKTWPFAVWMVFGF